VLFVLIHIRTEQR